VLDSQRQAAYGMGAPRWQMVRVVLLALLLLMNATATSFGTTISADRD
jgi:ABC-type phosphate transport system permease subunit